MIGADEAWGEAGTWRALRRAGERFTLQHYLNALDLDRDDAGRSSRSLRNGASYLPLLWRTLVVSLAITVICLVLGYPVAYLIANSSPARFETSCCLLVLLPFLDPRCWYAPLPGSFLLQKPGA